LKNALFFDFVLWVQWAHCWQGGVELGAVLAAESGPAFGVMQAVKQMLDPTGILNPGKIIVGSLSVGIGDWLEQHTLLSR
jgi:hypothetical protein